MYYTAPGILFIIISIIYANKHPEKPYPILNLIFIILGIIFLFIGYFHNYNIAFNIGKLFGI